MKTCFQYGDPLLDYEILWALTNLTALLRPDEIEKLFTKDYDVLSFIINKLGLLIVDLKVVLCPLGNNVKSLPSWPVSSVLVQWEEQLLYHFAVWLVGPLETSWLIRLRCEHFSWRSTYSNISSASQSWTMMQILNSFQYKPGSLEIYYEITGNLKDFARFFVTNLVPLLSTLSVPLFIIRYALEHYHVS